jgi:hypothetical protein
MILKYVFDGDDTKSILYNLGTESLSSGEILQVTGNGSLVHIEAAQYLGAKITDTTLR